MTCEAYCVKHKTWCSVDHDTATLSCPHKCPHPAPPYLQKEVKKRKFHAHLIMAPNGSLKDTCCWRQKA